MSLNVQFAAQTRSGHPLPPSIALLAEPVHVSAIDPDMEWEHERDNQTTVAEEEAEKTAQEGANSDTECPVRGYESSLNGGSPLELRKDSQPNFRV